MIDDHAQRIKELREVEQMEKYSTPLLSLVLIVLAGILISFALDVYTDNKFSGAKTTADIFAQCLSGAHVEADGHVITCVVKKSELTKGM